MASLKFTGLNIIPFWWIVTTSYAISSEKPLDVCLLFTPRKQPTNQQSTLTEHGCSRQSVAPGQN